MGTVPKQKQREGPKAWTAKMNKNIICDKVKKVDAINVFLMDLNYNLKLRENHRRHRYRKT